MKEERWVIVGWGAWGKRPFLYTGQYLLPKDAIEAQCEKFDAPWAQRHQTGDRAVKATIEWEYPK